MARVCMLCLVLLLGVPCYAYPPQSLYSVAMYWRDDRGEARSIADFEGGPVIVTMAFTSCSSACPLTMERLRRLDGLIQERGRRVAIVVVSLDPDRDTPELLHKFRESHRLVGDNWHFLIGSPEDTRKISLLLGISYQKNLNTADIMHSNKLVLLDSRGVISKELEGLNSDLAILAAQVEELVTPLAPSSEHH